MWSIINGLVNVLFCSAVFFAVNTDLHAKHHSSSSSESFCSIPPGDCAPEIHELIRDDQEYNYLYEQLCAQAEIIMQLLDSVSDCTSYENLYNFCQGFASSIPNGRIVVALPDGTVVVDTYQDFCSCESPDCQEPQCPNIVPNGCNGYNYFINKFVNENHNTRVAVMAAQMFPCGVGCETKYSTTVEATQSYVAIRLGPYLNSLGTVIVSQTIPS